MASMSTEKPSPAILCVAPNGARKTLRDHPDLPMTPAELGRAAAESLEAGAAMVHLHVRDRNLAHILDAAAYRAAIRAIRSQVGDRLVIQVTTESCGLYGPEEQMGLVRELRPEAVSLSVGEIFSDTTVESAAAEFLDWLRAEGIFAQFIVFDADQVRFLVRLIHRGIVPHSDPCVLFVLGRHTPDQQSAPADLDPLLEASPFREGWFLCAFGKHELACVDRALAQGGHARIGFENNLYRPDGTRAAGNAELVGLAATRARKRGRSPANADHARELFAKLL
ncbi:MAG: 3-keto-5-aminohexanoate cleavage protein [Acidobacteria bacterium]|nr:3-keto-5-aminohexanoate cleavage protein [Acidobacteriota bacterium]